MDFEHMSFRIFPRKAKHFLKDHRDVAHQIDGIIVHDNLPWKIVLFGSASLLLDGRILD